MKQLSGTDTMFLDYERGNNYMHVASLTIYDPSTAPGGGVRFKDVLRFFASRLEQFPQFRRRLATVPLSLDRPYWIEDSSFDVEFHVRHIAVPHPTGPRRRPT
ncbi:MAG: diacylglycerol O-acyltransferase / wax synthase [Pseudomonadota bacterium]|nr:diacylglycerol O-acyltransferase / wax synthase [Pseudomonadota bacterium]